MAFTTTTANSILNKILNVTDFTPPATLYVSLHTADPGETGLNEVTGGSYIRQSVDFEVASAKATTNVADISFLGMPATTVTHVGIWTLSSAGVFWWGGALTASKVVNAGDTFKITAGNLDVTLT